MSSHWIFRAKSEIILLDFQWPDGGAPVSSLILFHNALLLGGYATPTMNILLIPGTCQDHFLLVAFAYFLPHMILVPTVHAVISPIL